MTIKQDYVIRVFFKSAADAELAIEQLENIGVFGDVAPSAKGEPTPFKVIFTDNNLNLAKTTIRRISLKPTLVQFFDPTATPEVGFGEFSELNF